MTDFTDGSISGGGYELVTRRDCNVLGSLSVSPSDSGSIALKKDRSK